MRCSSVFRFTALALVALPFAGCGDSTGPASQLVARPTPRAHYAGFQGAIVKRTTVLQDD